MNYCAELKRAMEKLAADNPKTLFVGQGVGTPSTAQTDSFADIPENQRIEFPVAEDLQMGFCTGLALDGYLPVSVYPRWNFLLLAANQLINHLDKLEDYSVGGYNPKVIIRVGSPSREPFDPGTQHGDDFITPFMLMLKHIPIFKLHCPMAVGPAYEHAAARRGSSILVEYMSCYDAIPSGVPSGAMA